MRVSSLAFQLTLWPLAQALDIATDDGHPQQIPLRFAKQHSGTKRVAVIGAGAGGSSAAYHLRQLADVHALNVNITVFDRNAYVGGRSTTVNAYDDPSQPVELGASVFVEVNKILVSAARDLNLTVSSGHDHLEGEISVKKRSRQELGIWNGKEFVWRQAVSGQSPWETYYDYARLFWKYGLAPRRALSLVNKVIGRFLDMYDAPFFPFESISDAALALNLTAATAATGHEFLENNGISRHFADEIIQSATRVNYAQNLAHIHGLDTLVSLAADNAMSVKGGNWRIFDEMLKCSKARVLLDSAVKTITQETTGEYKLGFNHEDSTLIEETFDEVIVAAPFHQAKINIQPGLTNAPDDVPYVKLHVTLFTSKVPISGVYFSQDAAPDIVLTTLPPPSHAGASKLRFNSISLLRRPVNPATGTHEYLYKVFSLENFPTRQDLSEILQADPDLVITWTHEKDWLAYPYAFPRVTFEGTKLDNGIWYTSSIDSFISTMETNSLAGKNIATLIANSWI